MRIFLLILLAIPAFGQQPAPLEAELAPPVYSTLAQSGGFKWIAYGYLYPLGTFANRAACEPPPDDVQAIGSYVIRGEWGNAAEHAAVYRLTFGRPNDGKQFVMGGIFAFGSGELGLPETATYSAARLSGGRLVDEIEIEFTARSGACFGATVRVIAPQDSHRLDSGNRIGKVLRLQPGLIFLPVLPDNKTGL